VERAEGTWHDGQAMQAEIAAMSDAELLAITEERR
jgi:hypothetical protein